VIFDAILNKLTTFAAVTVLTALALSPASAFAGVANQGLSGASASNPLAGVRWGHFTGTLDGVYPAYAEARGRDRRLLAKIALRPLSFWFGAWDADRSAKTVARQYIRHVTGGDPNVMAQVTVFRLTPWEGEACSELPDPAQQASYKRWIDGFAAGIGSARVALILQPDIPFALCSPEGSQLPLHLIAYAARRFNSLPHTTVYIDGGTAAWDSARQGAWLLEQAGVRHARGFALNTTQTGSTAMELDFGAGILRDLAAAGIKGKHFVVNTAENGAPYLAGQYPDDPNDPRACRSRHDRLCVTLGIPPTTDTSARAWGLPRRARAIAARDADAYLWIGRPWLTPSANTFDRGRALSIAASTPF
jgi:endoglucanase